MSFSVRERKGGKARDPHGRCGAVRVSDGERRRQTTGGEGEIPQESNRKKQREREREK